MKCGQVIRLFGAYWDDETTQAEREWVEAHLASCATCRHEYEALARALELLGSLPRIEPAPDLVERVLSRARRASAAPDLVPARHRPWVPVTAALALAVLAGSLALPWLGLQSRRAPATGATASREPVRVGPPAAGTGSSPATPPAAGAPSNLVAAKAASEPDTIFDHNEDVEFILDPVRLQRGRATVTRQPGGVSGEKAVISF